MSIRDEILAANRHYAADFAKGHLPREPKRRLAIVTCLDARIDPLQVLRLRDGDVNVLRNAGAIVTDDVVRSLLVSHWLLGTEAVAVIGHTDCGMATFDNDALARRIAKDAGADASGIDFLPFRDAEESVRSGVQRIRATPLFSDSYEALGFVYDVATGRLREVDVPAASAARP